MKFFFSAHERSDEGTAENGSCLRNKKLKQNNKKNKQIKKEGTATLKINFEYWKIKAV